MTEEKKDQTGLEKYLGDVPQKIYPDGFLGHYSCVCGIEGCGREFIGDKRDVMCGKCAGSGEQPYRLYFETEKEHSGYLTSGQWCKKLRVPETGILDPDGWVVEGKDFNEIWTQKIHKAEFLERLRKSNVNGRVLQVLKRQGI